MILIAILLTVCLDYSYGLVISGSLLLLLLLLSSRYTMLLLRVIHVRMRLLYRLLRLVLVILLWLLLLRITSTLDVLRMTMSNIS